MALVSGTLAYFKAAKTNDLYLLAAYEGVGNAVEGSEDYSLGLLLGDGALAGYCSDEFSLINLIISS